MSTDSLDNVVGNHTCIVSNIFGSSSQGIVIEGGLQPVFGSFNICIALHAIMNFRSSDNWK